MSSEIVFAKCYFILKKHAILFNLFKPWSADHRFATYRFERVQQCLSDGCKLSQFALSKSYPTNPHFLENTTITNDVIYGNQNKNDCVAATKMVCYENTKKPHDAAVTCNCHFKAKPL